MAAVVIAATVTFLGFRPALPLAVRILVITLSGLATAVIYLIYRQGFGELEDGIGGLAQSLFGFSLPYPSYVPVWKVGMVMLALFFIFTTIYSGLMSLDDRERGLGLGLLAVTGLGLSNPQLVLMAAAGHLLLIDTLTREAQSRPQSDPDLPIEAIFGAVAQQFGLPPPVVLENRWGAVVAVRGDVEGTTLDLRARPRRHGGWDLTLRSGMMGRGRADVELLPDASQGGIRPPHAISRTHRVRGSVRALEDRGDAPLDALAPFHEARIRFWSAGVEVEFGRHLTALEPDGLSMLVRALSRWPTTSEDP
jgi:hypothetical protein